jgi:hypothetical protein
VNEASKVGQIPSPIGSDSIAMGFVARPQMECRSFSAFEGALAGRALLAPR